MQSKEVSNIISNTRFAETLKISKRLYRSNCLASPEQTSFLFPHLLTGVIFLYNLPSVGLLVTCVCVFHARLMLILIKYDDDDDDDDSLVVHSRIHIHFSSFLCDLVGLGFCVCFCEFCL